jgi:hypothetical protein
MGNIKLEKYAGICRYVSQGDIKTFEFDMIIQKLEVKSESFVIEEMRRLHRDREQLEVIVEVISEVDLPIIVEYHSGDAFLL